MAGHSPYSALRPRLDGVGYAERDGRSALFVTALRHSAAALTPRCPVVFFSPLCAVVSLLAFVSFPNPSFAVQIGSSRMPCGLLSICMCDHGVCDVRYRVVIQRSRFSRFACRFSFIVLWAFFLTFFFASRDFPIPASLCCLPWPLQHSWDVGSPDARL